MDLGIQYLKIQRLIIHRIIEREPAQKSATLEAETETIELDEKTERILFSRIVQASGKESNSFLMEIKNFGQDTFFDYATNIKKIDKDTDNKSFIDNSINLAELLASSQTRMNIPGGYLLVIDGINEVTEKSVIIVIKAEYQEVLKRTKIDNKTKLEVLEKVFLSPAQKLFKIGVLIENEIPQNSNLKDILNYSGILFDSQFRPESKPAEYFYKDFLGFSIDKNDKIQTQRLFDKTENFIKGKVAGYQEKTQYLSFLKNYFLGDQTPMVQPIQFAKMLFSDSNLLNTYILDVVNDLPSTFTKDPILIKTRLIKRNINFKNEIKISGPEQQFDDSVFVVTKLEELSQNELDNNSYTILKIVGKPYYND